MSELTSPPYPGVSIQAKGLYQCLDQYRDWVLERLKVLHEFSPDTVESLKPPAETPKYGVWEYVSVADKFCVLQQARYLREVWDAVVREHEDSWDSSLALQRRYNVVHAAIEMLDEAFLNPEVRENRQHQIDRPQRTLTAHMRHPIIVEVIPFF